MLRQVGRKVLIVVMHTKRSEVFYTRAARLRGV